MSNTPHQPSLDSKRSVRGSGASQLFSKAGQAIVSLGGVAVMARLLTPVEFGIAALAIIVPNIAMTFNHFGIPQALLRAEQPSRHVVRQCIGICARRNAWVAAAVVAAGLIFSWIYDERELFWLGLLLAPAVYIAGVTRIHRSLVEREMRFRLIAFTQFGSLSLATGVGIGVAYVNRTAFPLVLLAVVDLLLRGAVFTFAGIRAARHYTSESPRDVDAMAAVRRFGRDFTFSKIVRQSSSWLDQILVGYIAGPGSLGLYATARRWSHYTVREVHTSLLYVAVSSLSRLRDDTDRFRAGVRTGQELALVAGILVSAFLFLDAPNVILVAFGPQWVDVVPLFRVFLIAAVLRLPMLLTNQVYYAEGRTARQLRWTTFDALVCTIAIALGSIGDQWTIALAYTAAHVLLMPLALAYATRGSRARFTDYFLPWLSIASIAIAAMAITQLLKERYFQFEWLPLEILVSGSAYMLIVGSIGALFWWVAANMQRGTA